MSNLNLFYAKTLYKNYSKFGVFNPGSLKLGDIVDANTFERIGNVGELISFDTENINNDSNQVIEYMHNATINFANKLEMKKMPIELILSFSKKNSIYFSAKGSHISAIKNIFDVERQLLHLRNEGEWESNYVIITELVSADKVLSIVTQGETPEIRFSIDGKFGGTKTLINNNISFSKNQNCSNIIYTDTPNTSVLFSAKKIKRKWLVVGENKLSYHTLGIPKLTTNLSGESMLDGRLPSKGSESVRTEYFFDDFTIDDLKERGDID